MKKTLSIVILAALAATLVGCSSGSSTEGEDAKATAVPKDATKVSTAPTASAEAQK